MSNPYANHFKKKAASKTGKAPKVKAPVRSGYFPQKHRKKVKPFELPISSVIVAAGGLVFGLWASYNVDVVEKWLSAIEFSAVTYSSAQTKASEETSNKKQDQKEDAAQTEAKGEAKVSREKRSWTDEEISIFRRLDARKSELDQREEELAKLELELQRQKEVLDQRMKELESVRTKIASKLETRVEVDQKRVEKLVDFYSNMKPANAAKIFEKLNEDLAVEVLGNMKKKSAADILNLLPAMKAQRLSEKYAGYKRR